MSLADVSETLVARRRLVLACLLVLTGFFAVGSSMVEETTSIEDFQTTSPESEALEYANENFETRGGGATPVQLVASTENVLERDSLIEVLEFQIELRSEDSIDESLVDDRAIVGVPNAVARAAIQRDRAANPDAGSASEPTLEAQRDTLASMTDAEVEAVVESVLAGDGGRSELLALMPKTYEPGSTSASETIVVLFQDTRGESIHPSSVPDHLVESQLSIQELAADQTGVEYTVFGYGLVSNEIDSASGDSLAILGPIVLAFVVIALLIAYRDPLDVVLGLFGLVVVLLWTVGAMGWLGIEFSIIFIAIPILLVGLGIDYSIHVVMRYREARADGDRDVARGMVVGLGSVGVALGYVTATTVTGFLSNVVSPVPPIQEFGIVSAVGMVSALVVFGAFVPLVKVVLDAALEARGFDRNRRAFGTGARLRPVLMIGERIARRAPLAVVFLVIVVATVGIFAGANVDTSFETEEFLPESPPDWTEDLPASLAPGTYTQAATIDDLDDRFVRQELTTQVVVQGDVTADGTLERVERARDRAIESRATVELPNGEHGVRGPLTSIERLAAENESFNQTVATADTDGDGVPDRNLEAVYDALFAADESTAEQVLHREDGEYDSMRLLIYADSAYSLETMTEEARDVAAVLEGEGLQATATGQETVLFHLTEREIGETVTNSLALTLLVVGLFLLVVYRLTTGRASLGLLTLVPVVLALSGVLATMYALDLSFNYITGMITSLTIGLGVDYSIHVSERYHQELERCRSVYEALSRTLTGTGGALLGSAITTTGGFGILAFAFLPSLQQFGLIAATSIVYAFLASVLVLPSLLVLWTRLLGPDWATEDSRTDASGPAARSEG